MNYYTPMNDDHQHAFYTCLTMAIKIAVDNKCNQILLLVPSRGTLQSGVIEKSLQNHNVNKLLSEKKVFLDPITFFLQTRRSKAVGFVHGPVLAAYAYFEQLKDFIKNKTIPGIILYSNASEDIVAFKTAASAEELKITL